MDPVRKINEVIIAWTPDRDGFPLGFRGKARIFTAHGAHPADEHIAAFARSSGRSDERAHGPLAARQDLCREIALEMKRDGVNQRLVDRPGNHGYDSPQDFRPDADAVHQIMLGVDEYASDNAAPAPLATTAVPTCPKCASTTFVRAPAFTPFVHGHAPQLYGQAIRPHIPDGEAHVHGHVHSFAANPPSTQCTGCGLYWNETDLAGAGFRDQQQRHSAAA
jgi:hypothetical protein